MRHAVAARGAGRVELPAYGLADAEHQVEKEVRALWPDASVEVTDVARPEGAGRIVEEFRVSYRVRGTVTVEAETEEEARRTALRTLRERFTGSRHARIAWEVVRALPRQGG